MLLSVWIHDLVGRPHQTTAEVTFRAILWLFLCYAGSRYSHSNTNAMLVWISCFIGPWLLHKMILLVFDSVCALWGVPETFFSVRSAICSVGHPAVSIQTLLRSHSFSPLCTSFVDLAPQKMCTRTCPGRVGAFSTAEKVFPFSLPLIISKLGCGQGIATCATPHSLGAPVNSQRTVNLYWGPKYSH